MAKQTHEIRDPIHVFVRLTMEERKVVNSRPFQRLRHIHQLALTYLVYPGATHRRFEHSLGVMELAARIYDVVTNPEVVSDEIKSLLPELNDRDKLRYWCRVLRVAALCHDVGHLPFSHAAEKELLPDGWDHERLSRILIESPEMAALWNQMTPPLRVDDIVKLALGPKKARDLKFSVWETILSEIIVGDAVGADRIDYLLRDSHHAGVAYGRFDHYRLVDTLRILPSRRTGKGEQPAEPALGVEEGGIQSAEALLLARYLMYSQVYMHPVRRIYDIHLKDFLFEWLPGGRFPTDAPGHLTMTDNEVTSAMYTAAFDAGRPGHTHAKRLMCREHFKLLYQRHPDDLARNLEAVDRVYEAISGRYGAENVRRDQYPPKGGLADFPVRVKDGRIASAMSMSETLRRLPPVVLDSVYINPGLVDEAKQWLDANRDMIITRKAEEAV